jgi:hypothetical protein
VGLEQSLLKFPESSSVSSKEKKAADAKAKAAEPKAPKKTHRGKRNKDKLKLKKQVKNEQSGGKGAADKKRSLSERSDAGAESKKRSKKA